MKNFIIIILLCFISINANAYDNIYNVKYVRNYDGDTITFNIPHYPNIIGEKINIRVLGIDTPEIRGKCENEKIRAYFFKDLVQSELENAKSINIININRGKYFRIVGDIEYDGKLLSEYLLSFDDVQSYDGGTKNNIWCE